MSITSKTKVCVSISGTAGDFGCKIHNAAFQHLGLDYIYKSFSVTPEDLPSAINAIRAFGIRGAGISMPHKINALNYSDSISEVVREVGAANTIFPCHSTTHGRGTDGLCLCADNTDPISAEKLLQSKAIRRLVVLGNGGFARAVRWAANNLMLEYVTIKRTDWGAIDGLRDCSVFNCTPVSGLEKKLHGSCSFIDCLVDTPSGRELALLSAAAQFKIYTNHEFPMDWIRANVL